MEKKKNPRKSLKGKVWIFRLIGFNFTLMLVILAFRFSAYQETDFQVEPELSEEIEEEMADVTAHHSPPPPPPPEPPIYEPSEDEKPDEEMTEEPKTKNPEIPNSELKIELPPDEKVIDSSDIFISVEEDPSFPGGWEAFHHYLAANVEYPRQEREKGIQGIVYLTFVVEPDGRISNVEILEGVNDNLNKEAKRVVRNMPDWEPGKQRDHAVRVRVNLPISFRLGR